MKPQLTSLFMSAPYPGEQKFTGQPTGLLYALATLAKRKEQETGDKQEVRKEISVWNPQGIHTYSNSSFEKKLKDHLKDNKPRIVGVSTFSASYQNAQAICKTVRQELPQSIVMFGGAHEDNFVSKYKQRGSIDADIVVAGDGTYALDRIYSLIEEHPDAGPDDIKERILENKRAFANLQGAATILMNTPRGLESIVTQAETPPGERISMKLDDLPTIPRYLLVDEEESARQFSAFPKKKTAQMMVGQGCPFSCGFCSEGVKRVWYEENAPKSRNPLRSLDHIKEELSELTENNYEAIFFDDSTFFAKPKQYMNNLISLLQDNAFTWGVQTTQQSIYAMKDLLPEMRSAGLRYVYIGVEHVNGAFRDSFGKAIGGGNKFGAIPVEYIVGLLEQQAIDVGLSLTFGHPDPASPTEQTGETYETATESIDAVARLIEEKSNIAGVSLNIITYHPGTPISERYEKKVGPIEYTTHPNNIEPFTQFEEGIGPHAEGMTPELAEHILTYSQQKLGDKLWL